MSRATVRHGAVGRAVWFVLAGLLFAAGLGLSGMTQPAKVIGFLDFTGAWDPSLAFVMGGAVTVYLAAHRLTRRLQRPLLAPSFPPAAKTGLDVRLAVGAALFGVGWGLSGFCPGPAVVSLGAGTPAVLWFMPAMIAGMALHELLAARAQQRQNDSCG